MKQKILWLDLAVCALWMLAALGSRDLWIDRPAAWLVLAAILARIAFSFSFYIREKRSWVALALFAGATCLCLAAQQDMGIWKLISLPFPMLGINFDSTVYIGMRLVFIAWIWLVPVVAYVVALCCRSLSNNSLSWKEAFGAILWTDHRAKAYCSLMLIVVGTLCIGLAMSARSCLLACIVAPTLSYVVLNRYYGMKSRRVWLMALSLVLFFFAQTSAGAWRVGMLAVSLVGVVCVCCNFFREKRMLLLTLLSSLYLGVLLPSLAIGNNQYTCLNVGRTAYYSLDTYDGIFCIENKNTEKIGLRDRYGILVNPEYDDIVYHTVRHWFGELELRKNGYVTLYDICNNSFSNVDDIDHILQDSICALVEKHLTDNDYQPEDRIEVEVTDCADKEVSWIKARKNGSGVYYDYEDANYIPMLMDSVALQSGEIYCDSLVQLEYCQRQAVCYSCDVSKDEQTIYNIQIKAARGSMPKQEEVATLAEKIALALGGSLDDW